MQLEDSNILQIDNFSLEKHEGEYEDWPSKSKLFRNGNYVGRKIPGYCIEQQYLLDDGNYFFITSYDCPFEEQCDLLLLDSQYKKIARRSLIPWYYSSWNFDGAKYLGNNKLLLTFNKNYLLVVTLNPESMFSWRRISWSRVPVITDQT